MQKFLEAVKRFHAWQTWAIVGFIAGVVVSICVYRVF